MPTTRLPIVETLEPRSSSDDKDGLASNVFYEKDPDIGVYAVRRAGTTSYINGSGTALGIFTYDGQVFLFDSVNTPTPLVT